MLGIICGVASFFGLALSACSQPAPVIIPEPVVEIIEEIIIEELEDYIHIDLEKMIVFIYKDDYIIASFPIDAKAKEGAYWQTPIGEFEVLHKEELHYSTLFDVWMPYSIHFEGNFFIHGQSYFPNGEVGTSPYTGGCIRISDRWIQEIYKFAEIGMKIKITDKESPPDGGLSDLENECSCVTWIRENTDYTFPRVRYAREIVITRLEPRKGGLVIYKSSSRYSEDGHIDLIESVATSTFDVIGFNYEPCKVTRRIIRKDDPDIKGFFYRDF